MPTRGDRIDRMRTDARRIFDAGVAAVRADTAVKRHCRREADRLVVGDHEIDLTRFHRVRVVGAGKASAAMARAVEMLLEDRISDGLVSVKYGHTVPLQTVRLAEAGHPVPDAAGEAAARAMLGLLNEAKETDLVLCLLSGGGSALLPLPAEGLTLEDKQAMIRELMACGASIHEINTLRKHTSAIKGGRLAEAAFPATLVSLMLSDVVGDDLDVIASGPTVPDTSTFQDAWRIVAAYRLQDRLSESIRRHLEDGLAGRIPETPKTGAPPFEQTVNAVIGSNIEAIRAAAAEAANRGYRCLVLSSMIEGETREAARFHGAIAREMLRSETPLPPPVCLISGGETTVTIRGTGTGGRNMEFALAAAIDIAGWADCVVLSGGTDGTDGPTSAAGAIADHATAAQARRLGLDPQHYLDDNDSHDFFERMNDLITTGPTHTNVMDLRVLLVGCPG